MIEEQKIEILKQFLDKDPESMFFDIQRDHDAIFATDKICVIKTISDYEVNPKIKYQKSISEFFPALKSDAVAIDRVKLIDAIKAIPIKTYKDLQESDDEEDSCNECDGIGEVEWEFNGHYKQLDCPVCDGFGSMANLEMVEVQDVCRDTYVKHKDFQFDTKRVLKILECVDEDFKVKNFDQGLILYTQTFDFKLMRKMGEAESFIDIEYFKKS